MQVMLTYGTLRSIINSLQGLGGNSRSIHRLEGFCFFLPAFIPHLTFTSLPDTEQMTVYTSSDNALIWAANSHIESCTVAQLVLDFLCSDLQDRPGHLHFKRLKISPCPCR